MAKMGIFFAWILFAYPSLAKDFGVYGHVFLIEEEDLLEVILSKLKALETKGDLEAHKEKVIKKSLEALQHPKSLKLPRANQDRTFTYDPSYSYPNTLKDHNGQVFYTKGTVFNPLDKFSLSKDLVFVDGDDSEQMEWLNTNYLKNKSNISQKPLKVILVGGPIFEWMKKLNRPLYYDQKGVLIEKLGIKAVPAIVTQEGKSLKIQEIKVKGNSS